MGRVRHVVVLSSLLALNVVPGTASAANPAIWTVDLSGSAANVNVAQSASGVELADPRLAALASPTATGAVISPSYRLAGGARVLAPLIDAEVPSEASVQVDVRERHAGRWSEWVPAGSAMPAPAAVVQARITLIAGTGGASPIVHSVQLVPSPAGAADAAPPPADLVRSRVYATREGLVGGTTANGHVIVERDHFVALPSRRGLATNDSGVKSGNYTVRLCADNGRCEWAPVWDVGPWNTTDDYWNPAAVRERWKDLPQGKPQAQAAFEDQYNDGRDGFDREVSNPAGVDLGDGTFWDGLQLAGNSWVNTAYLWTDTDAVTGTATETAINVRKGPSADAPLAGLVARTAQVPIMCQAHGTPVDGMVKSSDLWDQIGLGYWISDAHLDTGQTDAVTRLC